MRCSGSTGLLPLVMSSGICSMQRGLIEAFCHLRTAESVFVHLELAGGATLRLTGDHFVPVGPLWAARVMKRAREVLPGDVVHTLLKGGAVATRQVDAVALDMGAGLYNPLTGASPAFEHP